MLTVEQRHALVIAFEAARHEAKQFERSHCAQHPNMPGEARIDLVLSAHIADELAQREFYEVVNSLTDWGMHPAAYEPARDGRQ